MNSTETRWENYRKANSEKPSARENELKKVFELVNPQPEQTILEVGTGNGYLTFPIAEAVELNGKIVTTDIVEKNIYDVVIRNTQGLSIIPYLLREESTLPEAFENYFDSVATIATLHHFDNRLKQSGDTGRRNIIKEFYRVIKPGGKLVIADPLHDTITQRYFDSIDNPEYCHPDGHPHNFFTKEQLEQVVSEAGFENIQIETTYVPWKFTTEQEAINFVHTIHNAQVSPEDSFAKAKEILGFKQVDNHFELGWELFFLTAQKKWE